MKTAAKIILVFIINFLFNSNLPAQGLSLGLGMNIPMGSSTQSMGFGLNLSGEYRFYDNYAMRLNSSFILSSLEGGVYVHSDTYTLSSFEGSFLYFPIKSKVQPYIGAGLGYYLPSSSSSSNATQILNTGNYNVGNNIDNSYGINILAGIRFASQSFISYNLELKYVFLKPTWNVNILESNGDRKIMDLGKLNLSELFVNFALIFNL
ncbi:MAG: OmpW family outer membrane protein [Bacteroidota bacterium]|nr:OmpW family outer membrane protein [Bacteroidota bacterium]